MFYSDLLQSFQVTWSRRGPAAENSLQILSIGDVVHINDPRFLIAKKPQDNVNIKFNYPLNHVVFILIYPLISNFYHSHYQNSKKDAVHTSSVRHWSLMTCCWLQDWELRLVSVRSYDSGEYRCQATTHPPSFIATSLAVVGKSLSQDHRSYRSQPNVNQWFPPHCFPWNAHNQSDLHFYLQRCANRTIYLSPICGNCQNIIVFVTK